MKMPFGKYGPKQLGGASDIDDVPASYLMFLYGQDVKGAVRDYIEKNMKGLKKQIEDGYGEQ